MPDDDWALAQGTVDVRNEERKPSNQVGGGYTSGFGKILEAAMGELAAKDETLREIDSAARWIVSQVQRVPDEAINTVAKQIVDLCAAGAGGKQS